MNTGTKWNPLNAFQRGYTLSKRWIASAPGSLMITGEHAVLYEYPAIVCAINIRLRVYLTPREDSIIRLESQLGHYQSTVENFNFIPALGFVSAIILHFREQLPSGFDMRIESLYLPMGLGSSAAVSVATYAALYHWIYNKIPSGVLIFERVLTLIRQLQGRASCADVAASVWGGTLYYETSRLPTVLPLLPPFHAIYTGYKTPTASVINRIQREFHYYQGHLENLYAHISECSFLAKRAIQIQDWEMLGKIFNQQQVLMENLGVSDPTTQKILSYLHQQDTVRGAKISGAGLGDCVIALGKLTPTKNIKLFTVYPDQLGVRYECA